MNNTMQLKNQRIAQNKLGKLKNQVQEHLEKLLAKTNRQEAKVAMEMGIAGIEEADRELEQITIGTPVKDWPYQIVNSDRMSWKTLDHQEGMELLRKMLAAKTFHEAMTYL